MTTQTSTLPDLAGISFSALCVIHCLALPLLAAFLPVLGVVAEMEVIHKGFVVFAALAALVGTVQAPARIRLVFAGIAALGVATLFAGAFVEAFHDIEVQLTVLGAMTLAGAHILRWRATALGAH